MMENEKERDLLRSYGRRKSKALRPGRAKVLDDVVQLYGIKPEQLKPNLDPKSLFSFPVKEVWFEIGFGGGEHLAHHALNNPDIGMIGCEPFLNGISLLTTTIDEKKIKNILIWGDDARLLMPQLQKHSLSKVFLLHPDPWPKTRHHKRRFVQPETLTQISDLLVEGGEFRSATDHYELGEWIKEHLDNHKNFTCKSLEAPDDWVDTRYCNKGKLAGRDPVYFNYLNKP